MAKQIDYVYNFLTLWKQLGGREFPPPRSKEHAAGELKPIPGRRFSLDVAWPQWKIAVEIDGGNRIARKTKSGRWACVGRHTQDSDYEKLNLLAMDGWRVLRFTTSMLRQDPATCAEQVIALIKQEEN